MSETILFDGQESSQQVQSASATIARSIIKSHVSSTMLGLGTLAVAIPAAKLGFDPSMSHVTTLANMLILPASALLYYQRDGNNIKQQTESIVDACESTPSEKEKLSEKLIGSFNTFRHATAAAISLGGFGLAAATCKIASSPASALALTAASAVLCVPAIGYAVRAYRAIGNTVHEFPAPRA